MINKIIEEINFALDNNDNKEKFNFFNYSIIDYDKEIERLK